MHFIHCPIIDSSRLSFRAKGMMISLHKNLILIVPEIELEEVLIHPQKYKGRLFNKWLFYGKLRESVWKRVRGKVKGRVFFILWLIVSLEFECPSLSSLMQWMTIRWAWTLRWGIANILFVNHDGPVTDLELKPLESGENCPLQWTAMAFCAHLSPWFPIKTVQKVSIGTILMKKKTQYIDGKEDDSDIRQITETVFLVSRWRHAFVENEETSWNGWL